MNKILLVLVALFLLVVGSVVYVANVEAAPPNPPPGQDAPECHGKKEKDCKEDPQPEHGNDCDHSEDHVCVPEEPEEPPVPPTPEPPVPPVPPTEPPTPPVPPVVPPVEPPVPPVIPPVIVPEEPETPADDPPWQCPEWACPKAPVIPEVVQPNTPEAPIVTEEIVEEVPVVLPAILPRAGGADLGIISLFVGLLLTGLGLLTRRVG